MTTGESHYEVLGVPTTASGDDILAAYKRLRRQAHPDAGGSDGMFRLVQHAFDVLSDPARRAAYDADRSRPSSGPSADGGAAGTKAGTTGTEGSVRVSPMQPPPPARPPSGGPVMVDPPLSQPEWTPPPKPRWTKWWVIATSVLAVPIIGLVALFSAIDQTYDPYGKTRDLDVVELLTGSILPFVVVSFVALIAGPPLLVRLSRPKPPPPVPLADRWVPREQIDRLVHGTPGRDLSVGRFGAERSTLGREGEQRTDRLLRESILPTYPAMRLFHGMPWPGTDHADIDHVLLVGHTVIALDSKLWGAGRYWWDGKTLFREGEERPEVKFGLAVEGLRRILPAHVRLYGFVVAHAANGHLDQPQMENAKPSSTPHGGQMIPIKNPAELVTAIHAIVDAAPDVNTLDIRLLRHLLDLQGGAILAQRGPAYR